MENSGIFKLDFKDLLKGLVMAVIVGFTLPIASALQSPDFNIFTVNWPVMLRLAENGAAIGFISYILKNFLSTSDGKVLGKIG